MALRFYGKFDMTAQGKINLLGLFYQEFFKNKYTENV